MRWWCRCALCRTHGAGFSVYRMFNQVAQARTRFGLFGNIQHIDDAGGGIVDAAGLRTKSTHLVWTGLGDDGAFFAAGGAGFKSAGLSPLSGFRICQMSICKISSLLKPESSSAERVGVDPLLVLETGWRLVRCRLGCGISPHWRAVR